MYTSNPPILSMSALLSSLEIFHNVGMSQLKEKTEKLTSYLELLLKSYLEDQIEIESHYKFYLDRQNEEIKSFKKDENLIFPKNFDFNTVGSLSNEVVEKLNLIKPPSLGAASRISGVTPSAIIALLRHVKKNKNKKAA